MYFLLPLVYINCIISIAQPLMWCGVLQSRLDLTLRCLPPYRTANCFLKLHFHKESSVVSRTLSILQLRLLSCVSEFQFQ